MDWDIFCSRQRNIPNLKRHKTSAESVRLWWNAHWNAKIVQWQLLYPIENASSKCKCWHSLMDIWKKKIPSSPKNSIQCLVPLHCTALIRFGSSSLMVTTFIASGRWWRWIEIVSFHFHSLQERDNSESALERCLSNVHYCISHDEHKKWRRIGESFNLSIEMIRYSFSGLPTIAMRQYE